MHGMGGMGSMGGMGGMGMGVRLPPAPLPAPAQAPAVPFDTEAILTTISAQLLGGASMESGCRVEFF
jgi:hypothetical protein